MELWADRGPAEGPRLVPCSVVHRDRLIRNRPLGDGGRTPGRLPVCRPGRDHLQRVISGPAGGTVIGATSGRASFGPGSFTTETGWSGDRDIRPGNIQWTTCSVLGIDWTRARNDDPLERGFRHSRFADQGMQVLVRELLGPPAEPEGDPA